jgi:Lon protease-like protein
MLKRPAAPADLPKSVPLFPLSGALLLPFSHRPLNIFEPRYIELIDAALRGDRLIGLIQPEDTSEESPKGRSPLRGVGCVGRLTHFEESGESRYFVILEGVTRFRLTQELTVLTPYRQGVISAADFASDFTRDFGEEAVDRERFVKMMRDYAEFANIELNWDEI